MVLLGFSWVDVIIGMLWVSLVVLVLVIAYKKLLRRLSKGDFKKEDYCVLENLEMDPVTGELPFYFTSEQERTVTLFLQDENMNDLMEIITMECKVGGNIVRFDSSVLKNGTYFYCLKTNNQRICKKMNVLHST